MCKMQLCCNPFSLNCRMYDCWDNAVVKKTWEETSDYHWSSTLYHLIWLSLIIDKNMLSDTHKPAYVSTMIANAQSRQITDLTNRITRITLCSLSIESQLLNEQYLWEVILSTVRWFINLGRVLPTYSDSPLWFTSWHYVPIKTIIVRRYFPLHINYQPSVKLQNMTMGWLYRCKSWWLRIESCATLPLTLRHLILSKYN